MTTAINDASRRAWLPAGVEDLAVEVDGINFRYLRAGSGPALLLLHGLLGSAFSWRFNLGPLGEKFTVLAPDLPGFGYSDRPAQLECGLRPSAERMRRFLEALGITESLVLGSSHGGALAIVLASLMRKKARKLVLVSPANPWSRHGRVLIPMLASRLGRMGVRLLIARTPSLNRWAVGRLYGDRKRMRPGTLEGYTAPVLLPGTAEYVNETLRCWQHDMGSLPAAMAQIVDTPTLVLWGDTDRAVYCDSATQITKRLRNSTLITFRGVGHLPYEEVPDKFNRAVLDFLSK